MRMTEIATDREADIARRSRWARALAVGLLSAAAAACAYNQADVVAAVPPAPTDYRLNHPITISEMLATLDIPVGLETRYLPRGMEDNIMAFAQAFKESGSSELAIVLPTGAPNSYAAAAMSNQIESILADAGVLLGSIHYRSYPAQAGEANAPIRLAYARMTASVGPCGDWTEGLARNNNNTNYGNFGCATQTNLAAMIVNPLDLLYPRQMTPPNAARRGGVLQNYQDGQATDTTYPGDFGGGVAGVGQ
jgi:pilus assembly protein CpaD